MIRLPKINCKHYDPFGACNKKPKILGLFRQFCQEVDGKPCAIAERRPKPKAPPSPPKPPKVSD